MHLEGVCSNNIASYIIALGDRNKRVPALGTRVQIGQFFNGHTRTILTAYPRMFSDDEYKEVTTGDTYSVS